jgi:hypothetical protein
MKQQKKLWPGIVAFGFYAMIGCSGGSSIDLGIDTKTPVVYINDIEADVYSMDSIMALASAGRVDLKAIVISYSHDPYNPYYIAGSNDDIAFQAMKAAEMAGMNMDRIPEPIYGVVGWFEPPAGQPTLANVDRTEPKYSEGARKIVDLVYDLNCTYESPLYIVNGGQLGTVADAYLIAKKEGKVDFTDRVVVGHIGGPWSEEKPFCSRFNDFQDSWASCIVYSKMRVLAQHPRKGNNPDEGMYLPWVTKKDAFELPLKDPMRWHMYDNKWIKPAGNIFCPQDGLFEGDCGYYYVLNNDYIRKTNRYGFDAFIQVGYDKMEKRWVPKLQKRSDGPIVDVVASDRRIAEKEWNENILSKPEAYGFGPTVTYETFEAEDAKRLEDAGVDDWAPDYRGDGYIKITDRPGSGIRFLLSSNKTSDQFIMIRFSNGEKDPVQVQTLSLVLNGEYKKTLRIPSMGSSNCGLESERESWGNWGVLYEKIPFAKGDNVLDIVRIDEGAAGEVLVDFILFGKEV